MQLPLALVERLPMDEYQQRYSSIEEMLKHTNQDAVSVRNQLEKIRIQMAWLGKSKEDKAVMKQLDLDHRALEERLFRLIKFNDYSAMIMASYPDATLMSYDRWFEIRDTAKDPVLIRGISKGKIVRWCWQQQRDFYFVETGYLGNYPSTNNRHGRKIYHRIVHNDMQHRSVWKVPGDRLESLYQFNPTLRYQGWRPPGRNILLVLNTDKPFKFYGDDRQAWIDQTIATIKQHTDRPIIIRDKESRQERSANTIYDALDQDVHAVVCYNSIAAVEAVAAGIPAFALAPTAAEPVASKDLSQIENPNRPDPEFVHQWLCSLSYGQFTLDEMLSGTAWRIVQNNLERETIQC